MVWTNPQINNFFQNELGLGLDAQNWLVNNQGITDPEAMHEVDDDTIAAIQASTNRIRYEVNPIAGGPLLQLPPVIIPASSEGQEGSRT